MVLVGDIGGTARCKPIKVPYYPSWWDGKNDAEYWRVSFMVPNLASGLSNDGDPDHSTYTHIVPQLKDDIAWAIPGGRFGIGHVGLRSVEPPKVSFVKTEEWAHFSFEVVLRSPFHHS